jgi:ubiquinone/menaquinone biosynthesis C-methylase UbiE
MEPKMLRRIQRYGWDLAADDYDPLWQAQLAAAREALMEEASLSPGERVIDVASGSGLAAFAAAGAVGPQGRVLGIDISGRMVETALVRAMDQPLANTSFARMDGEALALPSAGFDVALCALGLMYMPDPEEAVREMRRVLRPGGRMALAVWGERCRCGWAPAFPIVDAEVSSEVCPLFFRLGERDALAQIVEAVGFEAIEHRRIAAALVYDSPEQACDAAFIGSPMALAWSRFDETVRARVCAAYLDAISPWRSGQGYRLPAEFVIVSAVSPGEPTRFAPTPSFKE